VAARIRYVYRRPGKPTTVYDQWLVLDRPDVKVTLQENYQGPPLQVGHQVVLEPGAPIVWFLFPDAWHDIGRFHLADGAFTGWYTNLTTPVELTPEAWSAGDLFLDLWTPASGPSVWLDEDEFEAACRAGTLDPATRRRVLNERALIDLQVAAGAWPPAIARDIDLSQARGLLQT
jgi:predicted RNA-binding protein associated with RNAse of E/G family